jgi:hypothetical protein
MKNWGDRGKTHHSSSMFLHVYHLTHMSEIHISTFVHITVQIRVGRSYVDFHSVIGGKPKHETKGHIPCVLSSLPYLASPARKSIVRNGNPSNLNCHAISSHFISFNSSAGESCLPNLEGESLSNPNSSSPVSHTRKTSHVNILMSRRI